MQLYWAFSPLLSSTVWFLTEIKKLSDFFFSAGVFLYDSSKVLACLFPFLSLGFPLVWLQKMMHKSIFEDVEPEECCCLGRLGQTRIMPLTGNTSAFNWVYQCTKGCAYGGMTAVVFGRREVLSYGAVLYPLSGYRRWLSCHTACP